VSVAPAIDLKEGRKGEKKIGYTSKRDVHGSQILRSEKDGVLSR